MKKNMLRIFLLILITLNYNILPANSIELSYSLEPFLLSEIPDSSSTFQTVYVCTGSYAYAYHSRSNCPGLSNCRDKISSTDITIAANMLKRVPCCRCWNNVTGRCKDDNPNYGGYSSSDNTSFYTYVAIAIVAASAIVLSNDVYFYINSPFSQDYNSIIEDFDGKNWSFGFRKAFKNSYLEYGINNGYNSVSNSVYGIRSNTLGYNLNFLQKILNRNSKINFYLGPALNYTDTEVGYGGIFGNEISILDRLKINIRYEHTNLSQQIQAGLAINYQKKYFWKKRK